MIQHTIGFCRWLDRWLDDRLRNAPITTLAFALTLSSVLGMRMIKDNLFDLPSLAVLWEARGSIELLEMLGAWSWLAGLMLALVSLIVLLMPPAPGLRSRPSRFPLWLHRKTEPAVSRLARVPLALGARARGLGLGILALGAISYAALSVFAPTPDTTTSILLHLALLVAGVGLWLGLGAASAVPDGSGQDHRGRFRRTAGLVLVLATISSLLGALTWIVIRLDWSPLSWHLYSTWAIVHLCGIAVGFGALVDSLTGELHRRLVLALVLGGALVAATSLPIPVGEAPDTATDSPAPVGLDPASRRWFDAVHARLDRMPEQEPVLVVAAAGGGSRAAMFATLVLEALERTPTHGSFHDWSEIEPADSLADWILFISSVSGGSVASAHFVLGAPTTSWAPDPQSPGARFGVRRPRNTLPLALLRQFDRELDYLCRRSEVALKRERREGLGDGRQQRLYRRQCEPGYEGFDRTSYRADPEHPGWPVGSKRLDDMATDFNAALMRGLVLTGLERGESMSLFWQEQFGWSDRIDASGSRPLLLVNLTDVAHGTRLVSGFPELPPALFTARLEGGAVRGGRPRFGSNALTDMHSSPRSGIEEAVRMSANFPWGFALPELDPGDGASVLAIDGGVLDNSGIDTISGLFQTLELVADPLTNPGRAELGQEARRLLQRLARRGVVLLEIDSGAKPESPSWLTQRLTSVLMPLQSLSMTSYVRSLEASRFHSDRISAILERWGQSRAGDNPTRLDRPPRGDDPPEAAGQRTIGELGVIGQRLSHVTYSLDTENLMTAWGLDPIQKGALIARFIAEDASQRSVLRDEFEDLEGTNLLFESLLATTADSTPLVHFLGQLGEVHEELSRWETIDDQETKAARQLEYDHAAEDQAEATGQSRGLDGWIYVGFYGEAAGRAEASAISERCKGQSRDPQTDAASGSRWLMTHLDVCRSANPTDLAGQTLELEDPAFLFGDLPDEGGTFGPNLALLHTGAELVIEEVRPWRDTGFQFARARVRDATAD